MRVWVCMMKLGEDSSSELISTGVWTDSGKDAGLARTKAIYDNPDNKWELMKQGSFEAYGIEGNLLILVMPLTLDDPSQPQQSFETFN